MYPFKYYQNFFRKIVTTIYLIDGLSGQHMLPFISGSNNGITEVRYIIVSKSLHACLVYAYTRMFECFLVQLICPVAKNRVCSSVYYCHHAR